MGWFDRLKNGLSKTSNTLTSGIVHAVTARKLDDAMLEELEELLILADMGTEAAASLIETLRKQRFGKEVTTEEIKTTLADAIAKRLEPVASSLQPDFTHTPQVIMLVGVNGGGKTTSAGKLAHHFIHQGKKVHLAACDTFRAAAVEQLERWGEKLGCPVTTGAPQADPASVAYQALETAQNTQADLLILDTAGRLQNKTHLMEQLAKITRVLQKIDDTAPHHTVLVLDGTTGQNALAQVNAFTEIVPLSGIIITKLDGTARGGIVVALGTHDTIPIVALGVGEAIEDLQPFRPEAYARTLVGLNDQPE